MAAAAAAAIQVTLSATAIGQQPVILVENALRIRKKAFVFQQRVTTAPSPSSGVRRFVVAASKSPNEGANSNTDDPAPQDDLEFLLKLVAGSFAGAAAIKYGSILVPEITRPNITQALTMISAPVIVAVLILIKESRVQQ